jgi:hypothetical protein
MNAIAVEAQHTSLYQDFDKLDVRVILLVDSWDYHN